MKLTHPNSDQTVEVREGSHAPYLRNGWVVKTPRKKHTDSDARAAGEPTDPNPERGK